MATLPPPPATRFGQESAVPALADGTAEDAPKALVPAARPEEDNKPGFSPRVSVLPVEVDVAIPIRNYRVRHLLALAPGQLVESQWSNGSDLPLAAGNVQLAWTEFEVVDTKLAVRVTRVA